MTRLHFFFYPCFFFFQVINHFSTSTKAPLAPAHIHDASSGGFFINCFTNHFFKLLRRPQQDLTTTRLRVLFLFLLVIFYCNDVIFSIKLRRHLTILFYVITLKYSLHSVWHTLLIWSTIRQTLMADIFVQSDVTFRPITVTRPDGICSNINPTRHDLPLHGGPQLPQLFKKNSVRPSGLVRTWIRLACPKFGLMGIIRGPTYSDRLSESDDWKFSSKHEQMQHFWQATC